VSASNIDPGIDPGIDLGIKQGGSLAIAFCCLWALAGCVSPPELESASASLPAPSWQEAANASYAGALGAPVVLVDGLWQGEPYAEGGASAPRAGLVRDFLLSGDLDGDGAEESAVLIWTSSGGSGTYDYLFVLDRDAAGAVSARAGAPLGDRVKLRAASIVDGRVVLETVQAGPSDAACCPGQKMRRAYALAGDVMTEFSTEDQGRLSLADVRGDWALTHFAYEEKVPDGIAITLQVEDDRIAGAAGCNRYSGALKEGDAPGDVTLEGPMAVTRMMCPPPLMEAEQRYLQALQGLVNYSFLAGKLALTWRDGERMGALLFAPAQPSPTP
jgi:heat shock protein HslJ